MSFTRCKYDVQNYNRDLYQTVRPGNFKTNLPRNACDGCFNPNVRGSSFGNSLDNNLINVDSDLMGLNVQNTRCPEKKYNPSMCNEQFKNVDVTHYDDCPNFVGENTRLSNPPCTLRGTGWNRWEWLCQNPQDRSIVPFNIELNTSIMAKDDHRPCMPTPVNQRSAHPVLDDNNRGMYNGLMSYEVSDDTTEDFSSQTWKNCTQIQ